LLNCLIVAELFADELKSVNQLCEV